MVRQLTGDIRGEVYAIFGKWEGEFQGELSLIEY
jgi:hypothetical protein